MGERETPIVRVDIELARLAERVDSNHKHVLMELGKIDAKAARSHARLDKLNGVKATVVFIVGGLGTVIGWALSVCIPLIEKLLPLLK